MGRDLMFRHLRVGLGPGGSGFEEAEIVFYSFSVVFYHPWVVKSLIGGDPGVGGWLHHVFHEMDAVL